MNEPQPKNYEFREFRIYGSKRLLTKGNGENAALSPKVFDLLLYLVANSGRVIEKDELMSAIWTDTIVEESNLSQNISILRRVLGEKRSEHLFIATIPGHGYKFVADVREVLSEPPASAGGQNAEQSQISNYEFQAGNRRSRLLFESQSEISDLKSEIYENKRPNADDGKTVEKTSRFWLVTLWILVSLALGSMGFYIWRENSKPTPEAPIKTIAVLPFKPLVAENRDEALEMGMADTLIARLGGNREIVVRPLSSVRRFGNLEQDAQSAGRELGVESVLDGNVQRWGDKIRVNVRLVSTADGGVLWSGTFDEKFTDIFVVQDAISQKVAAALALRLSSEEKKYLSGRSTENVEAYRFYLQGRYHALKLTPPEIRKGIGFYGQAVDTDPLYALAFAGMAQAYASLPITSDVPPNEAFPQAKAAAQKALEIDERLPEAHLVLGVVEFWFEWDWTNGEAELKKAIAINPNNSDTHRFYSVLLTVLGRHDEAIAEIETARQLDPLSLLVNALKGQSFFYAGRDAEAITQLNKTLEIEPNFWIARLQLARVLIQQKRYDEAVAEAKKAGESSGGNSETVSLAGYALAKAERRREALAMLEELKSRSGQRYVPSYNVAMIYNGLGEREEVLDQLEKAFKERDARMILLKVEPKWNNLRSEPRFINLMKRMNFE